LSREKDAFRLLFLSASRILSEMATERFTLKEWASQMGKKRAQSLTPERRKEIASKAGRTRWQNQKKKKKGS
jgi:hypothetical protein